MPSLFAFIWKQQAATFPQVHFIQKEAPKPGRWLPQTRLGSSHLIYHTASPQRGGGPQETQCVGQQAAKASTRRVWLSDLLNVSYHTQPDEVKLMQGSALWTIFSINGTNTSLFPNMSFSVFQDFSLPAFLS